MINKLLSAILRGNWAIDPRFVEAHMPLVARMIQGDSTVMFPQKNSSVEIESDKNRHNEFHPLVLVQSSAGVVKSSRYRSFSEAPEGSVALIPVTGAVSKYLGECGEPGTQLMSQWVKEASAANNISGIVIMIDSPGGMVDGTQTLIDAIAESSKKTIAFIDDGMAASAGYWIASAADEIYASRATDSIGSIGVFCTLYDFKGYLEKMGVVAHQIYAPQSTEKNLDYKEALEGNYSLIQAELKVLASTFIKSVKKSRGSKLNLEEGDPFTGKMFFAPDAVKIGLIDGIKSLDEVLGVAVSGSNKNSNSKKSTSMFGDKFTKLTAAVGIAADAHTEESVAGINLQLEEKGVEGLTVVRTADLVAAENTVQSLTKEVSDLKTSNAKAIEDITAERDQWKGKAEEFGDQPGATHTVIKTGKDKHAGEGEFVSNPNASWNKNANKATGQS